MTIDSSPEALLLLHSDEMIALRYVCTDNHKYKKKKEKKGKGMSSYVYTRLI